MQIKMLTPYDNGTVVLAKGDSGEGLTDRQKAHFVRAGLAEEVGAKPTRTAAPKPATKTPAKGSAAPKRKTRAIKPKQAEALATPAPAPARQPTG